MPASISDFFHWKALSLDVATRECEELKRCIEEAAAFIAELDRQFKESDRLYDKIQALRVWERVREWLYSHRFPTAWETSVANANQQHDADAGALAEVRALIKKHELRDRRRHGRRGAQSDTPANTPSA